MQAIFVGTIFVLINAEVGMKKTLVGVLCGLALVGCGEKEPAQKIAYEKGDYEGRIVDWVLRDYSDESLIHGSEPSDVGYGKFSSMVALINQQKIDASKHVLDFGGCDRVESVLFNRMESEADNLMYVIHCSNGKQFNISSKEITGSSTVKSNSEKGISQSDAINECKGLISEKVPAGQKITYHELIGMSYYKAPTNGNVRLILDFDVENSQKAVEKLKAQCLFDPRGKTEIQILTR